MSLALSLCQYVLRPRRSGLEGLKPMEIEAKQYDKEDPFLVKISDICSEIFCIGRREFGFHLDGEIIRDGRYRICTFHILHVLLEMTKPNNDILFVF